MNKTLLGAVATLIYVIIPAAAQAGGCEDILKYINYNTNYNYSQLTTEQINMASFCSEKYRKQSGARAAQIEASYNVFSGKAQASEQEIQEEQEKQCHGHYGKEYLSSMGIQQSQIVSQQSVDALKACYDSTQFHLKSLTYVENSFSSSFVWNGPGNITFSSVIVSADSNLLDPSGLIKRVAVCSVSYKDQTDIKKPFQLASGSNVTVTCDRNPHMVTDQKTHDVSKTFPEGLVTIATDAQSITIPLIGISRLITPDDRIASIEGTLHNIQSQLDLLSSSTSTNSKQIDALDTRIKLLEDANKSKLKLFWKAGNNGMATCGQFCRDATRWTTPEGAGTCVAAKLAPPNDSPWSCDQLASPANVLCLCANFL
ncbi:hypothetical protein [Methylocystis heyeri]|uniref:Uncharacterized protein n=1 Tax=Methylocystis heyeri TaxID=391905 RepID=A0A6B8KE60_9HYPH|nr:hypothetical protein [Methylocystis heyeri]QGM44710.1 hypothetical protein H2LOC_002860 [Methylocystis heyeri]